MTHTRRTPLSRARIAAVALDLVDRDGVAALTMRGLASRLGVRAPSLYNHVESLDDVIDLVQETVNTEIDQRPFDSDDLRTGLAEVARSYRAAYRRHPNVLAHVVRRIIRAPTALLLYNGFAGFIARHGVPEDEVLACTAMIDGLVVAFAIDNFRDGFTAPPDYADSQPDLARALATGDSNPVAVDDQAFEAALGALLDHVVMRAAAR